MFNKSEAKGDVSIHSLTHPMKNEGGLGGLSPAKSEWVCEVCGTAHDWGAKHGNKNRRSGI
jgi:hypothetical protein